MRSKEAFTYEGSSGFGVLLLHGFTGDAGGMRELGEALHAQGYSVRAPLLPGHGTGPEGLESATWREWLACARREYTVLREECGRVAVAGLSMGGALAAILAQEYPVEAYIGFSPCVRMKQRSACAAKVARIGRLYSKNAKGERVFPLWKGYDVWQLAQRAMHGAFAITAPVLVFQSALDETIDPNGAKRFLKGVSAQQKELVWLEKSGHVCTDGPEKDALTAKTIEFLAQVAAG
ncbi:MAG: alpha/beta fold hydrolase [Eubacteriales bacterium]|nr:alpha/beta fold hydrolase [Eubacteriales bacterium]